MRLQLGRFAQTASLVALATLGLAGLGPAAASVPTEPPIFTNPLAITNRYFPFRPGAVKLFTGRDEGDATAVADLYLEATRTFRVDGVDVPTHILQETEFANGAVVEISINYFAQADDGTVYYFGEVVDIYEDGAVVAHDGSWLVGGPTLPGDPPESGVASAPAVFMPDTPELGDVFKPEDLFPIVDETAEVTMVGANVSVPAGRYTDAIRVVETTRLAPGRGTKWYAPGVGVVKVKARRERLELIASTLTPP